MRKLSVTLAFILLALAVLALTPYADTAHAVLSGAIAVAALLLLLSIVADRPKVESGPVGSEPSRPAALAPAPSRNQSDAEVVNLLAIFQEKGRLVDFLMGDIAGYSDAEVGAAGRVLHEGAKAALLEHFGILPMRAESEGSKITVPTGYAPDEYRLVGRISGEAPFRGTLIHHGWKVDWVKLPRLAGASSDRLPAIAPAEVELQ